MEHTKCDLCGQDSFEPVWNKEEREKQGLLKSVIIPGHIHSRNVICRNCGLVYVNPRMNKEELDKFYREDYRKIYGGKHSLEAEVNHAETAFNILRQSLIADDMEFEKKFKAFLDIGCSTGELIYLFGMILGLLNKSYGIEPNIEHYEIAKSKGLKVENCSIEDYNPGIKFDIITMLNALEHVLSPTDVLNKIHSLLNDGGYLLVSVPNLYNRTIHIPVDAFLSNAHLFNFSIDTLTQYFLKCGFKIVKSYQVVEEMGEKIYLLGQKIEQKQSYVPKIGPEVVRGTIIHLDKADKVYTMKMLMIQEGFK